MKKIARFSCLSFFAFTCFNGFAQLPVSVGGLGIKKKNDAEKMEKSKAKEPLDYIRSQYSQRDKKAYEAFLKDKDVLRDVSYDFPDEEKVLKSWENAVARDEQKLSEVQTLDPKFKWEKLETDYRADIEKAKEGMADARKDFDLRRAGYNTLAGPSGQLDYALGLAKEGKYENLLSLTKSVNKKNITDSIELFKKYDPQMKRIPQLALANEVFGKKLESFMSEELPKCIESALKEAGSNFSFYYEREVKQQEKTGNKETFSYQRSINQLEELLKGLETWFPANPQIKNGYDRIKTTRTDYETKIVAKNKEIEEARMKKLESTRMPAATLNDAQILADTKACIQQSYLGKGEQLLKAVIVDDWTNKRHKYTNQIISRTRNVATAIKKADGRCYIYYMTIHQSKNDNGSFERATCLDWELDWVSDENRGQPVREEIKCEYVK